MLLIVLVLVPFVSHKVHNVLETCRTLSAMRAKDLDFVCLDANR